MKADSLGCWHAILNRCREFLHTPFQYELHGTVLNMATFVGLVGLIDADNVGYGSVDAFERDGVRKLYLHNDALAGIGMAIVRRS